MTRVQDFDENSWIDSQRRRERNVYYEIRISHFYIFQWGEMG